MSTRNTGALNQIVEALRGERGCDVRFHAVSGFEKRRRVSPHACT